MNTFNPAQHLQAINSKKKEIALLQKDMANKIKDFVGILNKEYPILLSASVSLGKHGTQPLERKVLSIIKNYLHGHKKYTNNRRKITIDSIGIIYLLDTTPDVCIQNISVLLKTVGLYAEVHPSLNDRIVIKSF